MSVAHQNRQHRRGGEGQQDADEPEQLATCQHCKNDGDRVKTYSIDGGPTGRVFTTTMGAQNDLLSVGVRRLLVNACYWAVGLEDAISADSDVRIVGSFQAVPYGFRKGKTAGIKPSDLK